MAIPFCSPTKCHSAAMLSLRCFHTLMMFDRDLKVDRFHSRHAGQVLVQRAKQTLEVNGG